MFGLGGSTKFSAFLTIEGLESKTFKLKISKHLYIAAYLSTALSELTQIQHQSSILHFTFRLSGDRTAHLPCAS